MNTPDDDAAGFFSRWSRRKAQVHQGGQPLPAVPAALGAADARAASAATDEARAASPAPATPPAGPAEAAPAPKPTLQDVEQLDAKSDYRSFVAQDVDPEVRNAAFKKLFHSDPHFNVMDGLDVYIDDYNTPNPLPVAIMKTLVQARAMGLIDDELKEQDPPRAAEATGAGEAVGEGAGQAEGAVTADGAAKGAAEPAGEGASAATAEPGADAITAAAESPAQPVLVELKLVPDQASNDEPLSAASSAAPTAAGSVVPFPRRPGSANPA
ncbi:MAG: DUF3306 domain-containing protein [Betaproteobacteria bacterium]|nr:DUF3306 domain-containing protein [Betaproteobacteria bacterium]